MNTVDWIGFVGVFQILLAFILNLFCKLDRNDLAFILLNLIGAGLACLASVFMKYWPFIINYPPLTRFATKAIASSLRLGHCIVVELNPS